MRGPSRHTTLRPGREHASSHASASRHYRQEIRRHRIRRVTSTIFGIMLCPNVNAARSKYNWQVSQSVLHPTESTAESQRSWQLQTFHSRLGEPPLLWGMLMGRLKEYAETSMPALGLRRCPGPAPSEKARWPRESTISSSPRCERCRYHARLHPLHRGFHRVGAPGYGELAVTDGFVARGADGQ